MCRSIKNIYGRSIGRPFSGRGDEVNVECVSGKRASVSRAAQVRSRLPGIGVRGGASGRGRDFCVRSVEQERSRKCSNDLKLSRFLTPYLRLP